jgi:FkbM family methyltransferase
MSDVYDFSAVRNVQIPQLGSLLTRLLGYKSGGTFVEVGGYDGLYVSNTYPLAKLGWNGYYIEPIYHEACRKNHRLHKNVTVSPYAIGEVAGEVQMHVGGPLSTCSSTARDIFENLNWAKGCFKNKGIVTVQQMTLNDYLLEQQVSPNFDLLVVDVEGYEWSVFKNFDLQKWHPKVIICELHDKNDSYERLRDSHGQVREKILELYDIQYEDFTNTVFSLRSNAT